MLRSSSNSGNLESGTFFNHGQDTARVLLLIAISYVTRNLVLPPAICIIMTTCVYSVLLELCIGHHWQRVVFMAL